jgi:site-specific DNA recombinase
LLFLSKLADIFSVFAELQRKMALKRPQATHPRTIPSFYLLSGFIFCSCGHAMIGRSAKSHRHYYYMCNGSFKKGSDICDARALPKEKIERMVIDQVKSKILNRESLEELVKLVNQEIDSSHDLLKDRLNNIDAELNDVHNRLSKQYDALETGKLSLNDLAPRIKELRMRQDELNKRRLEAEVEGVTQGIRHVDAETIKSYAEDLKALLDEADIAESKAFLRSFIKRIEIDKAQAKILYNLPLPAKEGVEAATVLPMVTPSGDRGIRTPDLCDANAALSRLSYIPGLEL